MCLAIAPERKNVKTAAGGAPSRITSRVSGAIVAVSSVPEINPMNVNATAPMMPKRTAIRISLVRTETHARPPSFGVFETRACSALGSGEVVVQTQLAKFLSALLRNVGESAQTLALFTHRRDDTVDRLRVGGGPRRLSASA